MEKTGEKFILSKVLYSSLSKSQSGVTMVTVARQIFQTGILHYYVHYEQEFSQTLFFEHHSIITIILFVNYLLFMNYKALRLNNIPASQPVHLSHNCVILLIAKKKNKNSK